MKRSDSIDRIRQRREPWDIAVIGGGATGMGIAIDAATRGLSVMLCEQGDFGKGTSSRSTKLVHGGVRYLEQGNITLVRDALRERARLLRNAPHLVRDMPFLIPCSGRWQRFYYGAGLKLYDLLAGRGPFGRSAAVNAARVRSLVPGLHPRWDRGGVIYHDGQFDDARLLIHMARTAAHAGACVVNYAPARRLVKNTGGRVQGIEIEDLESGERIEVHARCVINAAGPFCDEIRRMDDPAQEPRITASQGVHLVLPAHFFPGQTAIIVPRTSDGRVLFVIPWHGHAIVGTTDTPIHQVTAEPDATEAEIEFLLETLARYLETPPTRADVTSVFVGIRPLVKGDPSARTASLSRDHQVLVEPSGMITIIGGKWTTYRKMAEDCVDRAIQQGRLDARPCRTHNLPLYGATANAPPGDKASAGALLDTDSVYGTDARLLAEIEADDAEARGTLHEALPLRGSHIVLAVRDEMARTVEDVLARRTRCLFLNATAAVEIAPEVARRMARLMDQDQDWIEAQVSAFEQVAGHYLPPR